MEHKEYYIEIKRLHNKIVADIVNMMLEHNITEVDLLGSSADHAMVTGYPSDGAGAMTLEVSKVYLKDDTIELDVILDVDTEELAASNPNGDISDAYRVYRADDFYHIIPCAGIEQVYESVWQVLECGK